MRIRLLTFSGICFLLNFLSAAPAAAQLGEYFAAAEERKVAQETEKPAVQESAEEPEKYSGKGRFYTLGQAAFLLGNLHEEGFGGADISTSVHFSAGYNLRSWLQTGIGAGYSQFQNVPVFPVFGEVRGLFANSDFSPYYALRAGHGFAGYVDHPEIEKATGGFMGEGQLGLAIRTGKMSFLLGGGYHFQKAKLEGTTISDWWGEGQSYSQERSFRRFAATCALKFEL